MYITHNIVTLKSILSSRKTVSHKGTKSCSPVRLQQGNNAYGNLNGVKSPLTMKTITVRASCSVLLVPSSIILLNSIR